jgi:hypothetical protein
MDQAMRRKDLSASSIAKLSILRLRHCAPG